MKTPKETYEDSKEALWRHQKSYQTSPILTPKEIHSYTSTSCIQIVSSQGRSSEGSPQQGRSSESEGSPQQGRSSEGSPQKGPIQIRNEPYYTTKRALTKRDLFTSRWTLLRHKRDRCTHLNIMNTGCILIGAVYWGVSPKEAHTEYHCTQLCHKKSTPKETYVILNKP